MTSRRAEAHAAQTPIVLASASPRRHRLLDAAGFAFEVIPADIDEAATPGEAPAEMAERLAREKALAVARRLGADSAASRVVLAADTIVVLGARVLGKPRDPAHAVELLSSLVGRTHQVVTGVALARVGARAATTVDVEVEVEVEVETLHVVSQVRMRDAERAEIEAYVATGEPLDKAGAYAVQGEGRRFVTSVEGSETNVIGLPMDETRALLARAGVAGAAA